MIMMKIMIMMKRMMIMKGGKRDSGRGGGGRKEIQRRPPVGGGFCMTQARQNAIHTLQNAALQSTVSLFINYLLISDMKTRLAIQPNICFLT